MDFGEPDIDQQFEKTWSEAQVSFQTPYVTLHPTPSV